MSSQQVIQIGSRLELFVDDFLIDNLDGVHLKLHSPQRRDVVMTHDVAWEGNVSGYNTVFQDGDIFRMYYRGWHWDPEKKEEIHEATACYAESKDGLVWSRPSLGLIDWDGNSHNNIILDDKGTHNFVAFKDGHPSCSEAMRYKGLGRGNVRGVDIQKLYAFCSPDGIRWSLMQEDPLALEGAFDSQNLAFWDANVGQYRMYFREFSQDDRVRGIMTSLSDDFIHWTPGEWLDYPDAPSEHLYTNQIQPYHRAPHIVYWVSDALFARPGADYRRGVYDQS